MAKPHSWAGPWPHHCVSQHWNPPPSFRRPGKIGLGDVLIITRGRAADRWALRHLFARAGRRRFAPGRGSLRRSKFVIGEMLTEGAIAADERERMCIAAYIRTPAETLAAFAEGGSRVGLRLLNSRFSQLEDSGWTTYQKDGNAEALAARRAGFFRATFGPSLAGVLNLRNAGAARKAFADQLESGMRRHFAGNLAPIKSIVAILSLAKI